MKRETALAKLRRMLGKNAAYQFDARADANERVAASAALPALRDAVVQAKAKADARREELLRDPEYIRLCEEYRNAENARSETLAVAGRYRITAGTVNSVFFSVVAQGDTWPEVFAKIKNAKS